MKVPSVVRLVKFAKLGTRKPPLTRINLLARDNFTCQYCERKLTKEESTIDHVVPKSKEGKTTWQNVVIACPPCNRKKGGRTPKEAKMQLKKEPCQPDWLPVLNFSIDTNLPIIWKSFLRQVR